MRRPCSRSRRSGIDPARPPGPTRERGSTARIGAVRAGSHYSPGNQCAPALGAARIGAPTPGDGRPSARLCGERAARGDAEVGGGAENGIGLPNERLSPAHGFSAPKKRKDLGLWMEREDAPPLAARPRQGPIRPFPPDQSCRSAFRRWSGAQPSVGLARRIVQCAPDGFAFIGSSEWCAGSGRQQKKGTPRSTGLASGRCDRRTSAPGLVSQELHIVGTGTGP